MFADFTDAQRSSPRPLKFDKLETLQINLGNRCNQLCRHCHVEAGPNGNKIMSQPIMRDIIDFVKDYAVSSVDLTGGCPELNPHFKFFVESLRALVPEIKIRTNLTIMLEPAMNWLPEWYKQHKLVLIASLPCYTMENVDRQRGKGVFEKSIKAMTMLNSIGYGIEPELELHLVYNPGSAALPAPQTQLEADYKQHLLKEHGIVFNKLFTIANAPIGRFRQYLESSGNLDKYLNLLKTCFNPQTLDSVMCRNLISVDYQGFLYNCDFNQILKMSIHDVNSKPLHITRLKDALEGRIEILTGEHCFSCTAGAGSSCKGILTKAS
jgi:radical SAM/Cys-rich protein